MDVVVEVWRLLTETYPAAGLAVAGLLGLLLLVWGIRASAF